VALQGDYGQDVATQAASGVEPCAPRAPIEGYAYSHSSSFSSYSPICNPELQLHLLLTDKNLRGLLNSLSLFISKCDSGSNIRGRCMKQKPRKKIGAEIEKEDEYKWEQGIKPK